MRRRLAWLVLFLAFPVLSQTPKEALPQVEFFSPQGTVKGVRQVAARFSEPMVVFGDPRLPEPFSINCPEQGKARWADARNWVYDFGRDLPAGVACRFTLKPELKTLAGRALAGTPEFAFDTGGPAVLKSLPGDGANTIDEQALFILALDASAKPESITAHAHCEVEGVQEQIGVELLAGAERQQALDEARRAGYSYRWLMGEPGDAPMKAEERRKAETLLVPLRCQRTFPPATDVRLVWGAGIQSESGVATTQDQVLKFKSRPGFAARFECERVNAKAGCLPMRPMWLSFTTPVPTGQLARVQLKDKNGQVYPPSGFDAKKEPLAETVRFEGPFPEATEFTVELPDGLVDDAGRALENAARFPLAVRTDDYPPLAKFPGQFGIVELKADAVLPVTLRNLEASVETRQFKPGLKGGKPIPGQKLRLQQDDAEIIAWLKRVERAGDYRSKPDPKDKNKEINLTGAASLFKDGKKVESFQLPKPGGAKEFEVVGIPLKEPGFYVVELASPRLGAALLGQDRPRYVATSALVTNLVAHLKRGREASLVWVTTLDEAKPVAEAEVAVRDCQGKTLWQGKTDANGMARIGSGLLPDDEKIASCNDWGHVLFVSVRKDGDMAFVRSNWNKGIETWDFNLPRAYASDAQAGHTVFDRTLLRAGETVHMKHFVRRHRMAGIDIPEQSAKDLNKLTITHEGSGQEFQFPLSLDAQGIGLTDWSIPAEAKRGVYQVTLGGKEQRFSSGSFRVEDYRVPTMRAVIQPPAEPLVNVREAQLDLLVTYLAGGGASQLPVKLRTLVEPKSVYFPDYEDFDFTGDDVREGIETESPYSSLYEEAGGEARAETPRPAQVIPLTLDQVGAARVKAPVPSKLTRPQQLLAELEYQDANGELLTVSNRIPLWPARLHLGIKPEGWTLTKDAVRFQVLALDLAGKPVAKQAVQVDLFQRQTYSHRKRLIGGFYGYENITETKRIGEACKGTTDDKGLLNCEAKTAVSGDVTLRAQAKDNDGNVATAGRTVWVASGDEWWFEGGGSDRMDVLPERKSYEAGETARFQVRMPFREATALVTVEREGVIDAFIQPISGKAPVIDVPIKPNYAPNVYVSVLAVRGRVGEPQPTALVDLGKPAFRLGIAPINVGWRPHELKVRVTPDAAVHKVRETATVRLKVDRADGGPLPSGSEVALAAVDEGLLELMPNHSWQLLEAMMQRRGIEVETATAQMQVVGKRHYGRKAVPHGGGGGRQSARELFDTLLLWNGRVPLDDKGEAVVPVTLNDSLTSFRIAAVANAGADLFGTGESTIRSTQDLMLHSGLPPLVREGDRFTGTFTVRNATAEKMAIEVEAKVTPETGAARRGERPFAPAEPQSLEFAAGEAREVSWPVDVPVDAGALAWEVGAKKQGGETGDRIKVRQPVIPALPVRVFQATLEQLDKPLALEVVRPRDAIPGRGGVHIGLKPKLSDGLTGVTEYMTRYPYACLEQRISKAVALRDPKQWEAVKAVLPAHLDSQGLLKYFPSDRLQGSEVLTAYVLAITAEAGWEIPEATLGRLKEGLRGFVGGQVSRESALAFADLTFRKLAAIEALSRYGEANPDMLGSLTIDPNLWPTSAVIDWFNILKRLETIPERDKRLQEAQQILRSRLNFQGTTMGFSTEERDGLWWLMVSPDENAVRMLLSLVPEPAWREDIPRLARGALGRQHQGHWDTTPANAWGRLAMERFGQNFESTPVSGQTVAKRGQEEKGLDWSKSGTGGDLDFPWPDQAERLTVEHQGKGKPWAFVESRAAIPLKAPLSTGYTIQRTVTPVEQKAPGRWGRGDVVRVTLAIEAQADKTWVVVDDPIPTGASILGTGLGRDSQIMSEGERREGWVWPAYEERRFDAFRAYYEFVPKGRWTVEYTLRLNNPGTFELPPTRVEALYAPEMFGEWPNGRMEVE
jgi:uncharacterized protein YfaS (alpha-2-macroglobulin family)